MGGALTQSDWFPYMKRRLGLRHTQMIDDVRTWEEDSRLHAKEASGETNPADTLISDFQPPALRENKLLSFKAPYLWYFVIAALAG